MPIEKIFNPSLSYTFGVLRKGESAANNPKPQFAPRKSITVHGSTLREKGVETVQQLFEKNPFGMKTGRDTVSIFQISPDGQRQYFAEGIFFTPTPSVKNGLEDKEVLPELPQEEPVRNYHAPLREHNESLKQENYFLKSTIEQQNQNIAQVLAQNGQFLERVNEMLDGRILAERKIVELESTLNQEKSLNQLRDDFRIMMEEERESHKKEIEGLSGLGILESPLVMNLLSIFGPAFGKKLEKWLEVDGESSPTQSNIPQEQLRVMQTQKGNVNRYQTANPPQAQVKEI